MACQALALVQHVRATLCFSALASVLQGLPLAWAPAKTRCWVARESRGKGDDPGAFNSSPPGSRELTFPTLGAEESSLRTDWNVAVGLWHAPAGFLRHPSHLEVGGSSDLQPQPPIVRSHLEVPSRS